MVQGMPSDNRETRPIAHPTANISSPRARLRTGKSSFGYRRAGVGEYRVRSKAQPDPQAPQEISVMLNSPRLVSSDGIYVTKVRTGSSSA